MSAPFQNEIVVASGGAEFEVRVAVANGSMPVGRFLETVTGTHPQHVLLDGYPISHDRPVGTSGIGRGSRLEAVDQPRAHPVCLLVGVAGIVAGNRVLLAPGVHKLGDGPGDSVDVDVQVRGVQGGTASLYVDVDGAAQIDPGATPVTVGGYPIRGITRLTPGDEVGIAERTYRFSQSVAASSRGSDAFNRPPRAEFPAGLPLLVAPAAPPATQQPMRFGWGALVIPVLIGGLMAVLWSPMMAIFAIFSPAMMLANWYEDKRRVKRDTATAAAGVSVAMVEFEQRFAALRSAARTLAWRATPGPEELVGRICDGDSRLWQRRHDHPDFMELGIGVGTIPWAPEVTPPEPDRAAAANELLSAHRELAAVPITVDLGEGRVLGIAGHRRRQIEMVRWLLIQAATHHGPSDLAVTIITDHPAEWDCIKWLPHLQRDGDSTRLAVATPGDAADEILAPLLECGDADPAAGLRERPAGGATLVVVDVADVTTAAAGVLRRVLNGEGQRRRCGIAVARSVEELPSSCSDIVRLDGAGDAFLETPSRARRIGPIVAWRLAAGATRRSARIIGRYRDPDLRTDGGSLADIVHLLDLIGLGDRSSDAVLRRWNAGRPVPRCAAPIGATADGALVVDWVGDGPHGLLAGTTGAGKSELLRSLVASLAATVDPEHLNFVLIDYKGGSAFDACAGLPHTVGMVTDLDGHLAHRALTCLEAELRYREELLRGTAAENIDDYQARQTGEPLPRLLVVIDEFAALAKELPDFMAALVDIAQRGRSLGVHLLLATQRPSGVINDSIRANTNLRLSLRVQDVADSVDVIGTPDAAALARTRPGRGYLRRGPGDVVAFQSALVTGRSGGAGSEVAVSPFGLLAESPQAPAESDDASLQSDLELLVALVGEAAEKAGMRKPRLPWPEALPAVARIDEIMVSTGGFDAPAGEVVIGIADEPHRQRRRPFTWSIDGNLFIYGVQGCGTSNALAAAVLAACRTNTADDLHVYAMDFDDQTLGILEPLPHVGAVIGAGERDRQIRLLRYLQGEVALRREQAVVDPAALAGAPRIVFAVDNYAGFRAAFDDPADMAIKESLGRLVADGPGVGIVVVATAKQPIDIPTTVAALVTSKLVMRLADRYEYTGLGVSVAAAPETPGRAFEAGTSLELQIAIVGAADVVAIASASTAPTGERSPWDIGLLPVEVKVPDIVAGSEIFDLEWRVPVGIGDDRLQPVGWSLREGDHVLVAGPPRSGKSTTLATIATVLRAARPGLRITALTPRRSLLADCAEVDMLVTTAEQLQGAIGAVDPESLHAVLIDDAEDVEDSAGIIAALVAERLPHRHIFAAGAADVLRTAYGHWTHGVRRSRQGFVLKPPSSSDGDLWHTSLPRNGPAFFPAGRGYLIGDGRAELTQVAWQ